MWFAAVAALGLCGCTALDKGFSAVKAPPTVTITAPSEGAPFAEGVTVQFAALARPSREEDAPEDLLHEWVTGSEVMCQSDNVNADGTAICSFAFHTVGDQTATVTVTDPEGETATATVSITITSNAPPSIYIVHPQDDDTFKSTEQVKLEAIVDDPEDPLDQLVVTITANGTALDLIDHPASDGRFEDRAQLESGDQQIVFTVTDLLGKYAQDSVLVHINSPPTEPKVRIKPDPALAGDALTATRTKDSQDPDGDAITYEYEWAIDGVPYGTPSSSDTLPADVTLKNQLVEVWVTPGDTVNAQSSFNRGPPGYDSILIENRPPTLSGCSISPSQPNNDDDLAAVWSGWNDKDGDAPQMFYEWKRWDNGAYATTGITSEIFPANQTTRGDELIVVCTPYDGTDVGDSVESPKVTVANAVPEISGCEIYPADPTALDDLVATPAGVYDDDGDEVEISYKWYVNGIEDPTETGQTYPALQAERGDDVKVECTPSDEYGTGKTESGTASIGNSPPVPPTLVWDDDDWANGAPATGDALTVMIDEDAWDPDDGDLVSYTYTWYVDGVLEPTSPNQTTITAGSTFFQEFWEVRVVASDGTADAAPEILTVTIGNKPPEMTTCQISPYFPGDNDDLDVIASGFTDAESQAEDYHYVWSKYDAVNAAWIDFGVTGDTLPKSNTALDDQIRVTCVPWDGYEEGTGVDSITVRIGNTAPLLTGCTLGPTNADTTTTLVADATGFYDADNDPEGYTYKWYRNGAVIPVLQESFLGESDTEKNDEIYVECYPNDGFATGTPIASNVVVIGNSKPDAPVVAISPADPEGGDGLTAYLTTQAFDVDGDAVTYWYYWSVNGQPYSALTWPTTQATINPGIPKKMETWSVDVEAHDGTVASDKASDTVIIENALPSIQSCYITPNKPRTNDDLTAVPQNWWDADQDAPSYKFRWWRQENASWVDTGVTTQTYSADLTERDETYKVKCTPTNGSGDDGDTVESTPGKVIQNTPPTITQCTLTPNQPTTNDDLYASATGWEDADGDPPQYTYNWYVNNALDATEKGSVYPDTKIKYTNQIQVECVPKDAYGSSAPQPSGLVTVINSPPPQPTLSISPSSDAVSTQKITVTASSAPDPDYLDGDTAQGVTFRYYWSVDGQAYPNPTYPGTKASIATGITQEGEYWEVEVRGWDGITEGPGAIIGVDVVNSPPEIDQVAVNPTQPTTVDDLTAVPIGWYDADADAESYVYYWYIDDGSGWVLDAAETSNVYPEEKTYRGLKVKVNVVPDDGKDINGQGTPVESSAITIKNSKPVPPVLIINPAIPGDDDDLHCVETTPAYDDDPEHDGNLVTTWSWYSHRLNEDFDATEIGLFCGWVAPSGKDLCKDLTEEGEGWECTATVSDGIDTVSVDSPTRYVQDLAAPPPPVFDTMPEYRNADTWTVSGTCEADCTLQFDCWDDNETFPQFEDDCSGIGTFQTEVVNNAQGTPNKLDRGETTECKVRCKDTSNNIGGYSDHVQTEACSPYDVLELTYPSSGNTPQTSLDNWVTLADNNSTTVTIQGNLLEGDAVDWYVIHTSDDTSADEVAGKNVYNVRIEIDDSVGAGGYTFLAYLDGYANSDVECPIYLIDGYSEYNDRVVDRGEADHPVPSDPQACKKLTADRNQCENMGAAYYIKVMRDPGQPYECDQYTLKVTNGSTVWN